MPVSIVIPPYGHDGEAANFICFVTIEYFSSGGLGDSSSPSPPPQADNINERKKMEKIVFQRG